jgi:hypothetical protein
MKNSLWEIFVDLPVSLVFQEFFLCGTLIVELPVSKATLTLKLPLLYYLFDPLKSRVLPK